jgi:RNA polymerase sigma factor (sigma-70 family)
LPVFVGARCLASLHSAGRRFWSADSSLLVRRFVASGSPFRRLWFTASSPLAVKGGVGRCERLRPLPKSGRWRTVVARVGEQQAELVGVRHKMGEVVHWLVMSQQELSDVELLARADEDAGAFSVFYRRHERGVVAYVGRMVGGDAELTVDVVAETFARAYESRRQLRGESARAWLLGIARHVAFAAFRAGQVERDARRRLNMEPVALSDATVEAVAAATAADDWLAGLPDDQREAVRRRVLEDEPYEAIARDLSCSPDVIRQRVSRGLGTLRRLASEGETS